MSYAYLFKYIIIGDTGEYQLIYHKNISICMYIVTVIFHSNNKEYVMLHLLILMIIPYLCHNRGRKIMLATAIYRQKVPTCS